MRGFLLLMAYGLFCGIASLGIALLWGSGAQLLFMPIAAIGGVGFGIWAFSRVKP